MEVRFLHLINHLTTLRKKHSQEDQVRKILSGLIKEWELKVTAIEEIKGESIGSVTVLFGSLAEYESKQKYKKEINEKNRKGIALRTQESEDDNEEDLEDNEMGLIIKRFKKFHRNKAEKRFQSKCKISTSQNELKEPIIYFECKKPGHIKAECPQLSKIKDKEKKKVLAVGLVGLLQLALAQVCLKAFRTNKWYIDSGCSRHMTGDTKKFTSLKLREGGKVSFGGNQSGRITGIEEIGSDKGMKVEDMYYVEGLCHNLLSVS
ncbi:uncharacterized protein LOC114745756 [Neltuma alba]|uniref:uncharacterized protein LOC114745756 n=1 Tax=Neltuma alba TaxID=207710 RepID=UPI0010A48FD2|nr:uncharacterized protein LOC114745756 [Prosopis alba]